MKLHVRIAAGAFVGVVFLVPLLRPAARRAVAATAGDAPPIAPTALRLARSDDGLVFKDAETVFLQHASSPDLVVLPNGHLLAMFDYSGPAAEDGRPALAVARSRDEGKSWSRPRTITLQAPTESLRGCHGDMVLMPGGDLRIYFQVTDDAGSPRDTRETAMIGSATTRDGLRYQWDRDVRIPCEGTIDVHPSAVRTGPQLQLFAAGRSTRKDACRLRHFESPDGRRFREVNEVDGGPFVGNVIDLGEQKLRVYVTSGNTIRAMASVRGLKWKEEPAVCLTGGTDPAVVALRDGTFLMLYGSPLDPGEKDRPQLALASGDVVAISRKGGRKPHAESESDDSLWQPWDISGKSPGSSDGDPADASAAEDDGFPPEPDFWNEFDYVQWYEQEMIPAPEDNAYEAYRSLIEQAFKRPDWDGLTKNMLGSDYGKPAGPWDPAERPDFEEAYQMTQGLIEEFRQATLDPRRFACPADIGQGADTGIFSGERLLLNVMLPSLAHFRGLCKGVISNAWRKENGRVPAEPMREAWATVLRNGNHLRQGGTLIEHLVGIAEQALTEDTARRALRHDVFKTEEDLQNALDTLRTYDTGEGSMSSVVRGEYAMVMDMVQHVVRLDESSGEPSVDPERIRGLCELVMGPLDEKKSATVEEISRMTPAEIQETCNTIGAHYHELARLWQTGYPTAREADFERAYAQNAHSDALVRSFLPGLGRAYKIETRVEASRRATQLCYELHLFKTRNGRWPETLAELPPEAGDLVKTDPFTGGHFGYRRTDGGFTVYSLYENGTDDGGTHNPDDGTADDSPSDDFVFWPPRE